MKKSIVWFFAIAAITVLAFGCIPTQRAAFDPGVRAQIKSIGLLTIYNPTLYDTLDFAGPEGVSGLIAPGRFGGARASDLRKDQFQAMMASSGFDFSKALTDRLKAELQGAGYLVIDVFATRDSLKALVKDYSNLNPNVDSYLDIAAVFIGYNCNDKAFSRTYRPRIIVHANLIRSSTKELTYAELINYGDRSSSDCIYLPVSEEYQYEKFAELLHAKTQFMKGMNEGINKIAAQIARDLSS